MNINYPSDLRPIIQQLKVPQDPDEVVKFSAWYEQLEAYFAQFSVLKALFHAEKLYCPQYTDKDLRPLIGKPKVYTESVNMLQLPSTPGEKIINCQSLIRVLRICHLDE